MLLTFTPGTGTTLLAVVLATVVASRPTPAQELGEPAAQLNPQNADTLSALGPRDPRTARMLGTVIPGAGHLYVGEPLRAYLWWVGTVSGILGAPFVYYYCLWGGSLSPEALCYLPAALVGIGGISTWRRSIRDAGRAADRANERWRGRQRDITLYVAPAQLNGGGFIVGVALR